MIFFGDNKTVAQFAADISVALKPDYASITIILLARSEVSYVRIATDTLWEDTVVTKASAYSWLPLNISVARTLAG